MRATVLRRIAGVAIFACIANAPRVSTPNMTAVQYAIGGASDLNNADSTAINGGNNYFAGGLNNLSFSASQTINLAGLATSIDAGHLQGVRSGYLDGFASPDDSTTLTAGFRNGAGASLGSDSSSPPIAATSRHWSFA